MTTHADIEGEIVIHRPAVEVFDFVADERNEPLYNPRLVNVEQLSTAPIGLGTRFSAETTKMGRRVPMVIDDERARLDRSRECTGPARSVALPGSATCA